MWLLLSIGGIIAGAMVVWHEVGRNKEIGFMLLNKYEELLARAREEKAKELERERERLEEAAEQDSESAANEG